MTHTRDKLNEAKYFLDELRRVSSDPDKFRYELTAFLSANRSITLIMQKEFSEKTGFPEWYEKKQCEMMRNPTLKYLNTQRVITFHIRPVISRPVTSVAQNPMGMRVVLTGTSTSQSYSTVFVTLPPVQSETKITYYFDDISEDKDVITLCQEAVAAIEPIVTECEAKFT